jgi:hypothetical protein
VISYTPPPSPPRRRRFAVGRLVLVLLLANVLVFSLGLIRTIELEVSAEERSARVARDWIDAARDVAVAQVGEKPGVDPAPPVSPPRVCDDMNPALVGPLNDAVALMRATATGLPLYDIIQAEGICIGGTDLPYNSAFASARWSSLDGWAGSEIRIDRSYFTSLYPDVLAAILVHEAIHIQRAVERTACYYADACSPLPNGVFLEEEVVAHAAEAQFWIDLYGRDGKDWAFDSDHAQNQLKAAFLRGPIEFEVYIARMRSDDREGQGI